MKLSVIIPTALAISCSSVVAQSQNDKKIPAPFTADGYTEGEFRLDVSCSQGEASAVLQRDQKSVITLTVNSEGKKQIVTLFKPKDDLMDTCYYSLICRNVSKRMKIVAREDPACGRTLNNPIYHAVDVSTLKYEKINPKVADQAGLEVELINEKDPNIIKALETKLGNKFSAQINIYLASNEGPNQNPGDMLAASIRQQPNTFFSGKDHTLLFMYDGKPELVTGRFKGKGFNGVWSGNSKGVNYQIETKKTVEGEDVTSGTGLYKMGDARKITWAFGEFP